MLFWKPRRKPAMVTAAARQALGLKPEDQAYNAIADALQVDLMADGTQRVDVTAAGFFLDTPNDLGPFIPEPTTPAQLSPDYHAGLASRMIERLNADENRLADALEAEQRQHDGMMAALRGELAGVRKVREAYEAVSSTLQPMISAIDDVAPTGVIHPDKPRRRRPKPAPAETE